MPSNFTGSKTKATRPDRPSSRVDCGPGSPGGRADRTRLNPCRRSESIGYLTFGSGNHSSRSKGTPMNARLMAIGAVLGLVLAAAVLAPHTAAQVGAEKGIFGELKVGQMVEAR